MSRVGMLLRLLVRLCWDLASLGERKESIVRDGVTVGLVDGVVVVDGGVMRLLVEFGGAGTLTERERLLMILVGEVLDLQPMCMVVLEEDVVEVVACVAIEELRWSNATFDSALSLAVST